MHARPLISVMLPNYNHGRFLTQAFESILGQTYRHVEILFTDDGSSDDSRQIAESFASRDARIKPVFFPENRGSLLAAQNARDRATGEYLYAASADDYIVSERFFESVVAGLRAHPGAAGFYDLARTISTETGDPIGRIGAGHRVGYIGPEECLHQFLLGGLFIPGTSSIWRRTLVDETGPYDLILGPLADYYANHALAARYGIVFGGDVAVCNRVSESQRSYSSAVSLESMVSGLKLFESRLRQWTQNPPQLEAAWDIWRRNQAVGMAIRFSPFQRRVAGLKHVLREALPLPAFTVLNISWRQTAGRFQRIAARFSPAFRQLQENLRSR